MGTSSAPVTAGSFDVERRVIRFGDLVSCNEAFIDCRTPGSERKENYALIGPGVSQSSGQFVNLAEPHGYNVGAAAMPHGVVNSLHLHFTAEVFFNFGGEWSFSWGTDGTDGSYLSHEGDIISMPTWIFRSFVNAGPDDGWLFTALGEDNTGGIIWGPSVLKDAEAFGLFLTRENVLIDRSVGDALPEPARLIQPIPENERAALRHYSVDEIRQRVTTLAERSFSSRSLLCYPIPGGRAELAAVIGYGMTEDRDQHPRVTNPHGFSVAWLRAAPGEGILRCRSAASQVVIVRSGEWRLTLWDGDESSESSLFPRDAASLPANAWRALKNVSDATSEMIVINGGDGRVNLEWDSEVVEAAHAANVGFDASGYLSPWSLVRDSVSGG